MKTLTHMLLPAMLLMAAGPDRELKIPKKPARYQKRSGRSQKRKRRDLRRRYPHGFRA